MEAGNEPWTGIDPSKWESVFESFEQADPSTTRLHGGTGLGLCIVKTLVNKMNGEINVVKKNGPGTLMQLYLLLNAPEDRTKSQYQFNLKQHNLTVFLALSGRMTRLLMTQWLQENGVQTREASDWNELTQNRQEPCIKNLHTKYSNPRESNFQGSISSILVIIVDIGFLDLNTEIWEQQLDFLDKYRGLASFAWLLNHDTSNAIKTELRKRGHLLMINRPLYKAKMIQIFESVTRENNSNASQIHELLEIDTLHLGSTRSDDSEKLENECSKRTNSVKRRVEEQYLNKSNTEDQSAACSHKVDNDKNPLDVLHILLAEDTLVLQRVARIMLEKMGAKVVVVGDGIQVLDALNNAIQSNEYGEEVLGGKCTTYHT